MQRIPFRCICASTNVRIGRDQATAIPQLSFLFLGRKKSLWAAMAMSKTAASSWNTFSISHLQKDIQRLYIININAFWALAFAVI